MKILSLGAGVQSTTMLLMALKGEIERPDCAIFADTQDEPKAVYDHLERLKNLSQAENLPLHIVSEGKLSDVLLRESSVTKGEGRGYIAIPSYGSQGGMGRRQCTSEFKIRPIHRKIREILGAVGKRLKPGAVECWIGISLDEVSRMKDSREQWIKNRWPLIEKRMTRHDCLLWLQKNGYPIPHKSACIYCPYHDMNHWRMMKEANGPEWAGAVKIDAALNKRGEYLHRALKPLSEIDFRNEEDMGQGDMFRNQCGGYCGV